MAISRWILLRMRNVWNKSCTQNQNTHFIVSTFFPKIVLFMRKCGKNMVEPDRLQTIWRLGVVLWVTKATCAQAHARSRATTPPPLHTHTHTHTHRPICNTYCFSTTTTVMWTRLKITLYVHCLLLFNKFKKSWSIFVVSDMFCVLFLVYCRLFNNKFLCFAMHTYQAQDEY